MSIDCSERTKSNRIYWWAGLVLLFVLVFMGPSLALDHGPYVLVPIKGATHHQAVDKYGYRYVYRDYHDTESNMQGRIETYSPEGKLMARIRFEDMPQAGSR